MIKYSKEIVITTDAIEKAVEERHNVCIENAASILWPGDYMNDSCKYLCIEDWCEKEAYDDYQDSPDEEELYERWLILETLRMELPSEISNVLVDVSW